MEKIVLALQLLMDILTLGGSAYYRYRKNRDQLKDEDKK
jgi:hypothetical protein